MNRIFCVVAVGVASWILWSLALVAALTIAFLAVAELTSFRYVGF